MVIVILASKQDHSSPFGSTMMWSPILPIVTETGIVVIGASDSCPSTFTGKSSFISHFGIFVERIAAVEA